MIRVGIIVGSTRPGRNTAAVAQWVYELAQKRTDAKYELVDIETYHLPLLDEPVPPSMGQYTQEHTRKWAERINELDAFVFVTPEYNHGPPAALKNAIDFIYKEWNNKACGFVSFGSGLGIRAVEQLRQIVAELQMASVRGHVSLSLFTDFENMRVFKPGAYHEKTLNQMLDQVIAWGQAFKSLRENAPQLQHEIRKDRQAEVQAPH